MLPFWQGRADIKEQMQMIGHDGSFPKLHLGKVAVYLGQFLHHDSMAKGAENNMGEVFRCPWGSDVTLQVSEQPLPGFYTERNHIQARAAIVLPLSTAVLVVLDIMGM